ncbi:hypothetical protein ACJMK2_000492 [Sinanodonta woodiana]|uniref:non-specific serine/threonine protein kinase n=1 Tax=Sinanodonta woodiana TaxID=1069815 RepID=A0ABD3XSS4_SINWO
MDDRSIQLFEEALKDGKETVHSIRVMVVGQMGVGKTTLVNRLLGEEVNISDRHSTEGIDIYVNCCDVSLSTHEWTRRTKDNCVMLLFSDSGQEYRLERIAKVLCEQRSLLGKASDEIVINPLQENITESLKDTHATVKDRTVEILQNHSPEKDIDQDILSAINQQEESTAHEQEESTVYLQEDSTEQEKEKSTALQQEESDADEQEESAVHEQEKSNAHQPEEATAHEQDNPTAHQPDKSIAHEQDELTSHQEEKSASSVVKAKSTQANANTIAMIKLLSENVNTIEDTSDNALLTIWDFAGQYAFYTTHQTFLTRRAIYLLVSNVSEQVTDLVTDDCYFDSKGTMKCQVHELVEVWLNSIHSCASSPEDESPPVILVGTHVDKIAQGKHDDIWEKYFSEIRSYLKDKPTRFHLIDDDFVIDNTVVDKKLDDLKRKIVEVASKQPYWGEEIPARWLPLEQELMRQKSEELDLFLRYLHETGTIIYFRIEILRENIVLDPTWLIDALKTLINAHSDLLEGPADNVVSQKWSDFKIKGILSSELIDAVWTKEKYPELHAHKDHMLLIMEQLNIIAKPRAFSEVGEKIESYFLTPCMLRQESPREIISPEQDPMLVRTPVLCCVFTGKFLPPAIFHRLIAACITRWPVAKKKGTSEHLIFCGLCVFNLDLFHRLTLHCKNHIVFARITRLVVNEDKVPDAMLCSKVRKFITLNLSKITSYLGQNLKYELCTWWSPSQVLSDEGSAAPFQMWLADEGHDSDAPISPEHMNHARLYVALVTVCTNALRDILLTHVPEPYTNIYQAIRAQKADLTKKTPTRRGQWQNALLLPDQCQVVFPDPFGRYVACVDQFDITLLYILIRNVSTVPTSLMDWGMDPIEEPDRDKCLGASVERIRLYRNQIGHSMDGKMSQEKFDDYWNKIDAVLEDIEQALGIQGYRAQLEKQRRQVISVYEAC